MALNLGTLNVIFSADTRGFDRGMRKVKRSIQQLDGRAADTLDETADSTERIGREAKKTAGAFDKFGKNAKALGNKLRVLAFIGGGLAGTVVALRQEMAGLAVAAGAVVTAIFLEPVEQQFRSTADAVSTVTDRMQELHRVANDTGTRITAIGTGMSDIVSSMTAARFSMQAATDVAEGFAENMRGLGVSSEDVGSKLEDVAELSKQSNVTMGDLRDTVAFTDRPLRTLADALDLNIGRIRELIDTGQALPQSALVLIGQHLEDTAQSTSTLASQFNRLINTMTNLLDQTGIAGAVEDVMGQLNEALQSPVLRAGIEAFGEAIEHFIRVTLPNFVQSVVANWDTIVRSTKAAIGALVGAALGGAPGALIGGLVAGFEKTALVMGQVGSAVKTMAQNFQSTAAIIGGLFVGRALGSLLTRLGSVRSAIMALASSLGFLGGAAGGVLGLVVGGLFAYQRQATESQRETERLVEEVNNLTDSFENLRLERLRSKLTEVFAQLPEARSRMTELGMEADRLEERIDKGAAAPRMQSLKAQLESVSQAYKEQVSRVQNLEKASKKLQDRIKAIKNEQDGGDGDSDAATRFFVPEQPFTPPGGTRDRAQAILQGLAGGADAARHNAGLASRQFDDLIERVERLNDAARGIGDSFADGFIRAVVEGEKLSNVIQSIGKDIARMVLQATIAKPAADMITQFSKTALQSMFTAGGGAGGTSTTGVASAVPKRQFAEGGIANKPSIFGEAGPEAAIPLKNGSIPINMKGGGSQVIINDLRGADAPDVEQRETRGADGQRAIELTIRDTVAGQMQRGELDGPMRKRFGVGPTSRGR